MNLFFFIVHVDVESFAFANVKISYFKYYLRENKT